MNNKIAKISVLLMIVSLLQFIPTVRAEEINNNSEPFIENIEKDIQEEKESENSQEKEETEEKETPSLTQAPKADDNNQKKEETTKTQTPIEEHKVAVITTKVDENGNPLKGAILQILDSEGNVVDEWTSDGEDHTSLLPEGTYVLHEKEAPEGYKLASDKTFTVKAEIVDIDAGVDYSEIPCEHYGGTPLYYIEIEGEKYEVYCINQDWETPDENSIYDGKVLNATDIKNYTTQTVYIDAHQNTGSVDISEQSLSPQELYDKILDIIYHRQKASSIFSDLSEAEIRYVTESALKNYTNAGLTRVQRVTVTNAPENYESTDYYITDDSKYMWYLYPWYRSFVYDPTAPLGKDIFKTVIGEGDAFGNLARHWSSGHNAKNDEEIRKLIARYYELYLYLISDSDHHPSDMHLYIFATSDKAIDLSGYDFDDGAYQNLLGIRWYNPYDENHTVKLTYKNEKTPEEPKKETPKKETPKKVTTTSIIANPQTGDSIVKYIVTLTLSMGSLIGCSSYIRRKEY